MGRRTGFEFYDDFPEREMIGRIYRVETLGDGPRARTSFEFDALDERAVLGDGEQNLRLLYLSDDMRPFGLVRVVTTLRRFDALFGGVPKEGDWYRFSLIAREAALSLGIMDRLPGWHAQLTEGGYTRRSRGYVKGIELIAREGEPPLKSMGAAITTTKAQRQAAIAAAQFPNLKPINNAAVRTVLRKLPPVTAIKVHDVGQASFVTLYGRQDTPVIHYDAGWPVGFNYNTAPTKHPVCATIPVILSHWDWDHLGGYYRFENLQSVKWIVPEQGLGFGAGRIATRLDKDGLLMGYNGSHVIAGYLTLGRCLGPVGKKNQTGLALRVELPPKTKGGNRRAVLMTGDADYDHAPPQLTKGPLHGLLVTHHGATFKGSVPMGPRPYGTAIVSVGRGNCYQHPKPAALKRHRLRRWRVQMTMSEAAVARGPRWFI